MSSIHHIAAGSSPSSSYAVLAVLILISFVYVRSWHRTRRESVSAASTSRLASFLLGNFLIWAALGSPLIAYDHELLTIHMIQHLLLMTFAPGLILLGEPLLVFWHGSQRFAQVSPENVFQQPLAQWFARAHPRPTFCLIVSALVLIGWHVPDLFSLGVRSEFWHCVEQASFLWAGFLFWWPVVQPWPNATAGPQWSTLLYLFLGTLPCDILSGFLAFSDRVAYPVYVSMPRHFSISILEDQQCAAALMWTCVTLTYLVPGAILSTRLLSPRSFCHRDLVRSEVRSSATPHRDPQGLENI